MMMTEKIVFRSLAAARTQCSTHHIAAAVDGGIRFHCTPTVSHIKVVEMEQIAVRQCSLCQTTIMTRSSFCQRTIRLFVV